VDYTALIILIG